MQKFKRQMNALKQELSAIYIAYRDPRTPWYARVLAILVIAYALSPIDLIPDFIPVLGYLDDLILVPLGIYLTLRLIPKEVIVSARDEAASNPRSLPSQNRWGILIIILLWISGLVLTGWIIWHIVRR
jgi:uncharacterized membrane protein YkvA (DUF1232 family)